VLRWYSKFLRPFTDKQEQLRRAMFANDVGSIRAMLNAAPDLKAKLESVLSIQPRAVFACDYIDKNTGDLIWHADAYNLVTRLGIGGTGVASGRSLLDATFSSGSTSPAWFIGIIKQQNTNTGSMSSGTTSITGLTSLTTITGQQVTVFNALTGPLNLVTTISAGATGTTQTTVGSATLTATSQPVIFGPTFATTDTGSSHSNWTGIASTDVTEGALQALTLPAIGTGSWSTGQDLVSVDNSANKATYTPNANYYACGLFIINNSSFTLTGNLLYGEAGFTQGALQVQSGGSYSLQVTTTLQGQAG